MRRTLRLLWRIIGLAFAFALDVIGVAGVSGDLSTWISWLTPYEVYLSRTWFWIVVIVVGNILGGVICGELWALYRLRYIRKQIRDNINIENTPEYMLYHILFSKGTPLSPKECLEQCDTAFINHVNRALEGDIFSRQMALYLSTKLLECARAYYATSPKYGEYVDKVKQSLQQIDDKFGL